MKNPSTFFFYFSTNKKPNITTQRLPFHLTYSTLVSWGFKFKEEEIDLSSLNIGSVEANLFSKFNCLKKVTLKNNKLLRLFQNTFIGCSCLLNIDMSFNRLSQLQQGDFDGALNLQSIHLNNNLIEHIDFNTFLNLPHVVEYNFDKNPVTELYNFTLVNGILTSNVLG